ncbi:MAG: hypothetical protein ACLPSH_10270 [Vulcanimicrobiaceae bacterium]
MEQRRIRSFWRTFLGGKRFGSALVEILPLDGVADAPHAVSPLMNAKVGKPNLQKGGLEGRALAIADRKAARIMLDEQEGLSFAKAIREEAREHLRRELLDTACDGDAWIVVPLRGNDDGDRSLAREHDEVCKRAIPARSGELESGVAREGPARVGLEKQRGVDTEPNRAVPYELAQLFGALDGHDRLLLARLSGGIEHDRAVLDPLGEGVGYDRIPARLDEQLPAFGGERFPLGLGVFADMLLELLCLEHVYEGRAVVYCHPNTLPLLIQSRAIGVSLGY